MHLELVSFLSLSMLIHAMELGVLSLSTLNHNEVSNLALHPILMMVNMSTNLTSVVRALWLPPTNMYTGHSNRYLSVSTKEVA